MYAKQKKKISKHIMQNSNFKYALVFQISNLVIVFCYF